MSFTRQLILATKEKRAAILENNKVAEFYFTKEGPQVGDIYWGLVENVFSGLDAAFVRLGEEKNGYLHIDDIAKSTRRREDTITDLLKTDQPLLVQILKDPTREKGAKLTTDISLPGRFFVLLPLQKKLNISKHIVNPQERDRLVEMAERLTEQDGFGLIVRTEAEGRPEGDLARDYKYLTHLWKKIQRKSRNVVGPNLLYRDNDLIYRMIRDWCTDEVNLITVDSFLGYLKTRWHLKIWAPDAVKHLRLYLKKASLFDHHHLNEELQACIQPVVELNSGGFLVIESTEAFTVVDVNTGSFTGKSTLAKTIFRTNMEASAEVARQLRLRNIGGVVVVDFITMEDRRDKERVRAAFIEAMKRDKAKPDVGKFTELGLLELTRRRQGISLLEAMTKACPHCNGTGRILR